MEVLSDNKSDFISGVAAVFKNLNFIVIILLYIVGMILFSDLSINILKKMGYADAMGNIGNIGTHIQLALFVLAYAILDLLSKFGVI